MAKIAQPQDVSVKAQKAHIRLAWSRTFGKDSTDRFESVQKYVDSEVIRLMVKYTPMRSGVLSKGAVLGTKIGSGKIIYAVPYARYQYYGKLMVSSTTGSAYAKDGESKMLTGKDLVYSRARHPLAQRLWFETMKHNHKDAILRGAARISRRK